MTQVYRRISPFTKKPCCSLVVQPPKQTLMMIGLSIRVKDNYSVEATIIRGSTVCSSTSIGCTSTSMKANIAGTGTTTVHMNRKSSYPLSSSWSSFRLLSKQKFWNACTCTKTSFDVTYQNHVPNVVHHIRLFGSTSATTITKNTNINNSNDNYNNHNNNNQTVPFLLADIGEGIKEVEILEWFVYVGQTVEQFDKVCLVQSDKATVEITSRYDGVVSSLCNKNVGDMVQVGEPLLYLHQQAELESTDCSLEDGIVDTTGTVPSPLDVVADVNDTRIDASVDYGNQQQTNTTATTANVNNNNRTFDKFEASPAVRKLIKDFGITNVENIVGTGPKGRILKSDLLTYVKERGILYAKEEHSVSVGVDFGIATEVVGNGTSNPITDLNNKSILNQPQSLSEPQSEALIDDDDDKIITLKGYNRFMYKAMTESLRIPQMGFSDEIAMNHILQCRAEVNNYQIQQQQQEQETHQRHSQQSNKQDNNKISVLSFLIKACSLALNQYPIVNSIVYNDNKMELLQKRSHNIGIAMNTPRGLVVPVIKSCHELSIQQIQNELNRLRICANSMTLTQQDLSDATISLSNIGSIAGTYMNPVVVPPTLAIGAFGKIQTVPRFRSSSSLSSSLDVKNLQQKDLYAASIMYASWAADHRYLDGATLASFVASFKQYIEQPYSMLVHLK